MKWEFQTSQILLKLKEKNLSSMLGDTFFLLKYPAIQLIMLIVTLALINPAATKYSSFMGRNMTYFFPSCPAYN